VARSRSVFPLVPRRRVSGLPFGAVSSLRRGHGSDVAGSRAYVRGDPLSTIDWRASARLSTARGRDEFVVRERYAEEAPHVVVVCDFGPTMRLYSPPFPWLSKRSAAASATELIVQSALAAGAAIAYLDLAGASERDGAPYWIAPNTRSALFDIEQRQSRLERFDAPENGLERALDFLGRFRSKLAPGTFVFVVSDFLGSELPESVVLTASARRWEVVPVVVQDPTWEQSFPAVPGLVLPFVDPHGTPRFDVRLSRREARARRLGNERRFQALTSRLASLGLDPVVLGTTETEAVDLTFLEWAARRRDLLRRR
jgi:uncharacterized protein (DUF58 family)